MANQINESFVEIELYSSEYLQPNEQPTVLSYVNEVTCILGVIFGLGMPLNFASIFVIIRTAKPEPITLLILNLALADIVYITGILNAS